MKREKKERKDERKDDDRTDKIDDRCGYDSSLVLGDMPHPETTTKLTAALPIFANHVN